MSISVESKINYQQKLAYERLQGLFKETTEANRRHGVRAEKLVTVSGAIMALVGGAKFLPSGRDFTLSIQNLLLLFMFISGLQILRLASNCWKPVNKEYPSPTDTETIYRDFIHQDEDVAYANALQDLSASTSNALAINKTKSSIIGKMIFTLQCQVLLLLASISWPMILSLFGFFV